MNNQDAMNGLDHSLLEIDMALAELSPQMRRKMHREVVMGQIDDLLDQRNLVTQMAGELALQQLETQFEEQPNGTI